MYNVPDFSRAAQCVEMRNERIQHDGFIFTVNGAIKINELGDISFRFDEIRGMEENFMAFKHALVSFAEQIGMMAHHERLKKMCLQTEQAVI